MSENLVETSHEAPAAYAEANTPSAELFRFDGGMTELFDVVLIDNIRCPRARCGENGACRTGGAGRVGKRLCHKSRSS